MEKNLCYAGSGYKGSTLTKNSNIIIITKFAITATQQLRIKYPLSSGRMKYTASQHFSQLNSFHFKEHPESQEKQQQLELINLSVPKCKSDKKLQLLNAATINSSQVTLNA